jgi:hypothetical protein
MNIKTNILSYFIKDIKDPIRCAMYKQNNYEESITICYKNEVIFIINIENICNFINNIYKSRSINNNKCNYKIGSSIKFKQLFYKHDKNIKCSNRNYITFNYVIYKKYTIKTYFNYINNNILLFSIEVKYYNGYKYIIKPYNRKKKYTNNIILIMNKYELYYYNTFFNFYL